MYDVRRFVVNLAKVGLTVGILTYLYNNGMLDFSRVHAVLSNIPVVLFVFTLMSTTTLISAVRWWFLLLGQELQIKFSDAFRFTMIGVFFNTALPGAVSGDLVKGYYVVRRQPDGGGRIKSFITLFLDRLLGLSALICVSFASMLLNFDTMTSVPALKPFCGLISLLFAGVVVFYVFVLVEWPFSKRIPGWLKRLPAGQHFSKIFEAVKAYESCKHYVLKGLAMSLVIHCMCVSVFLVLAKALGGFEAVPVAKFFFLVPFGLLVTAIPVAPAGLGTGHYAFFKLFELAGSRQGADLFTAFVTFQIFISLIGGLFYIRKRT